MFDVNKFKVPAAPIDVFGGGHAPDSPAMQWMTKIVEGPRVNWTILGRKNNSKGCFTLVEEFDKGYPMYHVGYYTDRTPLEIFKDLKGDNKINPDDYLEVHDEIQYGIFTDIVAQLPEMFL